MSHSHREVPLYLSGPQPCSYLTEQISQSLFVDPDFNLNMSGYNQLLRQGFRRSGNLVYRPWCQACQQCLSVRLPVKDFAYRRRHRRILKANADITTNMAAARFSKAHFDLYQRYTATRHTGGSMADSTADEYRDFLFSRWADTLLLEMHLDGRLVGVAVTDQTADALSALYTFFDPELPKRSLGTFGVLSQISMARQLDLPYLYLGYWVRDCQKMAYKADFRPLELYSQQSWQRIEMGEKIEVPELSPAE